MDTAEFRVRGKQLIDYIADYHDTVHLKKVRPQVQPGYLRKYIPQDAPAQPEEWPAILRDIDDLIVPGLTHWLHPQFCAFFPVGFTYASLLADMLSDSLTCVGFSWASSPACTELEIVALDWLARMIGLPEGFQFGSGQGGGVLQGTASDCVFVCLVAARHEAQERLQKENPAVDEHLLVSRLTAYCSKEAHSCFEKAASVGLVRLRILDTDPQFRMRGETLEWAIQRDIADGLTPCFVGATLGTTSCTSCDRLDEIGPVCARHGVWLHVDAAYVGSALICPEFRPLLAGVEHAQSFNVNPTKWMLVIPDCSAMWVRNRVAFTRSLLIDPLYLQHCYTQFGIDYRHWGIPLSRRFRSLKLWCTIRNLGVSGLQDYIRNHVRLAKVFAGYVADDPRFELMNDVQFGLVCFRLKASNEDNSELLNAINQSGDLYMVASSLAGKYIIRYCVNHNHAVVEHIITSWNIILKFTDRLLAKKRKEVVLQI